MEIRTFRPVPPCVRTVLLAAGTFLAVAGGAAAGPVLQRFEYSEIQMGTPFRIVLYAPDDAAALKASAAAFARIRELDRIFSDYDPDSELSRLGRDSGRGRPEKVSPEMWLLLDRAQQLARASQGAFDVTLGPVVQLWRQARKTGQLPPPAALAAARQRTGHEKLRLDAQRHTVELLVPDMRLDLGAIAKGYAVDEALRLLRTLGLPNALVSGGGDMAAGEPPPGQPGWRIALASADPASAPPARFVLLANQGLATSGDRFQHLEINGRRYSHIIDPRTGLGLTDRSTVTVIAADCLTADSLATAVSVLAPEAGRRLVEATPGVAASITSQTDRRLEMHDTAGFARHLIPATGP